MNQIQPFLYFPSKIQFALLQSIAPLSTINNNLVIALVAPRITHKYLCRHTFDTKRH